MQIGEIAILDAWKEQREGNGNLDMMELVQQATPIRTVLMTQLDQLEGPVPVRSEHRDLLDLLIMNSAQTARNKNRQISTITRVWDLAALIYLNVVVSGWQPANTVIQSHVASIIDLLSHNIPTPALVRTVVWPFCVAGCLAAPAQEPQMRGIVDALKPTSIFGALRAALAIMGEVWRTRSTLSANHSLAACFRSRGNLVLLV